MTSRSPERRTAPEPAAEELKARQNKNKSTKMFCLALPIEFTAILQRNPANGKAAGFEGVSRQKRHELWF
jgi:hypothetical protein